MLEKANTLADQMIKWRRDIHQHPELAFEETRTASIVATELTALGYRVRTGVGKTGIMADLGEGRPTIALRADMDALPIQDEKITDYASQVPNVMHACGHDAHTAILLGVATLLGRETFPGTLRLLFQPAEEQEDDESISGAPRMIQDGAMENVDAVLALHVDSSVPVGDIQLSAGPSAAGVDTLYTTIVGKGGHGSAPHKVIDPIYLAGHVILALHGIVSRRLKPYSPAVISIGSIHGGAVDNVIPERVEMKATIRYNDNDTRARIHDEIERALGVARALGGDHVSRIVPGYPPMSNDSQVVEMVKEVMEALYGKEHILIPEPEMGSEDFGFFSALAPGAMFMLGCRIEGDERFHHHPKFDVDERCLPIGAAILSQAALRFLRKGGF